MIGPIDRNLNTTAVEEKLGLNPAGGVDIDVPLAGKTVISNVPCIHASEIVVMVSTLLNKIKHVYLDIYGASRTIVVTVDLGSVAVGTSALFKYTGGAGQTYDVRVEPEVGATVVKAWTCAR